MPSAPPPPGRPGSPLPTGPQPPRLPAGGVTEEAFRPPVRRVTPREMPRWRRILRVAWPVVLANLLQSLTLTVDLAFVGVLGAGAMAAAGLAAQAYWLALAPAMGLAAGGTALVARAIGAGDRDRADRASWTVLVAAFGVSVPLALALALGARPLTELLAGGVGIVPEASTFLVLMAAGLPANFLVVGLTGAFQGAGDTRPGLWITAVVNAANAVFDYGLIFGRLGMPELGLEGAAIATALSYVVGGILFLALARWGGRPVRLKVRPLERDRFRALAAVSAPASAEALLLSMGFTAYLVIILEFGASAVAGHQIGLRVQSFAFLPGFGFAAAAAALVGQGLGAGTPQDAEQNAWAATRLGLLGMMAMAIPLAALAPWIARLFTDDPEAVRLGATWIRVLVLAMPAIAIHFTVAGALRGAGDTRWPLLVSFVGLWIVRIPLAWVLAILLGLGMAGVWGAYVVDYTGRALATSMRFRTGRWKTLKLGDEGG